MADAGSSFSVSAHMRQATVGEVRRAVECCDCKKEPATRVFLHMTKGHFPLCEDCFEVADHDDYYLEFCGCAVPSGKPGMIACTHCIRLVRICDCHDGPDTWDDYPVRCDTCNGAADRFCEHKARFDLFHEELMAAAWHPTRVARWLDQGEDVLDMMFGL